ncbi:hypothetical protein GPJ56_005045 [Histomonas meleagridis]|uniref:uncharacterized protein n=1 Tax=Histomonas meleagridis TaxID=135588 RepID=UPI003559A7A1|nr:hypothetical protein GPJ56_005045 [Histomonas meleagridis]KAH0802562.1 hypothetical protein GO595_004611 [Histomonas meleagridis]
MNAVVSDKCSIKFEGNDDNLEQFITINSFGPLHKYDYNEYHMISGNTPLAVLVVEKDLLPIQKTALLELSNKYCGKMKFGWVSYSEAPEIVKDDAHDNTDLPMMIFNGKCKTFTKIRSIELADSGFFEKSLNNEICDQIFDTKKNIKISERYINNSNDDKFEEVTTEILPEGKTEGWKIILTFVMSGFALITVLNLFGKSGKQIY